jgi:hypothetical protein
MTKQLTSDINKLVVSFLSKFGNNNITNKWNKPKNQDLLYDTLNRYNKKPGKRLNKNGKIFTPILKNIKDVENIYVKKKISKSEQERVNVGKIIEHINKNTELGCSLKQKLYETTRIKVFEAKSAIGNNRKLHYDFFIIDSEGVSHKVEYKGSSTFKKINKTDPPWKAGVQFANFGSEKFKITEIYSKIWYDEYIYSGKLSDKYSLLSEIPKYNEWYYKDCVTQGNPKTNFGKELKIQCKKQQIGKTSPLLLLRSKINSKFLDKIKDDKRIIDAFSSTITKLANNILKEKDIWLQMTGNLITGEVDFKWYNNFILSKIERIIPTSKSDVDFEIFCSCGMIIKAKLRWGKGPYSNLRIDLK